MTNREKEIFIGQNFKLYNDGQDRNCQWLVVFRDEGDIMLGEDTAYQSTTSYHSHDSNFAIADEPVLNNGGGYQNRFDISFLFDSNYSPALGCAPLSTPPPNVSFSWSSHYDSDYNSNIHTVTADGTLISSTVEVHYDSNNNVDYIYAENQDDSGEYFSSVSSAKDYIQDYYVNGSQSIWDRFNDPLRTYIACMKEKLQCCLNYC